MAKYVLSPQAQSSLKGIRSYTIDNFGVSQATLYLRGLRQKIQHLAQHPLDGKLRDDIKSGYHSALCGSHIIFYRIRDTHIDIIDVLHQSMEPNIHL